jgi:hypothetical protein
MAEPFRLRVMKAISAQLKTIRPDNGYQHDLSDYTDEAGREGRERVFRGRTVYGENDPLPMLSVLETPRMEETDNSAADSDDAINRLSIGIMGFVPDDKMHPLDPAYQLSAEVVAALVKAKARFNVLGLGGTSPCIMAMSIGQPIHRPPDDEVSAVAYFLVPVTLTLAENLETPFA